MTYQAVVFDLLTALLDSWALWERVVPGHGLVWRDRYLELTYGAGRYVPYETLVERAAAEVGLGTRPAGDLIERWDDIEPWPETTEVLGAVASRFPVAVATNCSVALGHRAAEALGVGIPVFVTAEEVGWYKPDPRVYGTALERLGLSAGSVLFVAGSVSDVLGAARAGMDVYWHNRRGLEVRDRRPRFEHPSLEPLLEVV